MAFIVQAMPLGKSRIEVAKKPQENSSLSVTERTAAARREYDRGDGIASVAESKTEAVTAEENFSSRLWNLSSLQDFREVANHAEEIGEDQPLSIFREEEGTRIVGCFDASSLESLSTSQLKENHNIAVDLFVQAIIDEKGTSYTYFPLTLRLRAMEEGLTPKMIQQVFEKIDSVFRNVEEEPLELDQFFRQAPKKLSSNQIKKQALRVVLNYFMVNFQEFLASDLTKVDSELMQLARGHLQKLKTAQASNNLGLALAYRSMIDDVHHAMMACQEKENAIGKNPKIAWEMVVQTMKESAQSYASLIKEKKQKEVQYLSSLLANYHELAPLQFQIAQLFKTGNVEKTQLMLQQHPEELFKSINIYNERFKVAPSGSLESELFQNLKVVYGKIFQARKEAALKELQLGEANAWIDLEMCFQQCAIEIKKSLGRLATEGAEVLWERHRKTFQAYMDAAHHRRLVAQSMRSENGIEAEQHRDIAQRYEELAQACTRNSWTHEADLICRESLQRQINLNEVLLPIDQAGVRRFKYAQRPDFLERLKKIGFISAESKRFMGFYFPGTILLLKLIYGSLERRVLKGINENVLSFCLRDDATNMQQRADIVLQRSLMLESSEGDDALCQSVKRLYDQAAEAHVESYQNAKQRLYLELCSLLLANQNIEKVNFFLRGAINLKKQGDCFYDAAVAAWDHQPEIARRWEEIAALRKKMNFVPRRESWKDTEVENFHGPIGVLLEDCEDFIALKMEAINVLKQNNFERVQILDATNQNLQPQIITRLNAMHDRVREYDHERRMARAEAATVATW
ncbi:MAG: hypothetical protein K2W97_03930 [Chthoniobacterales bacterium]|nr:hypothetical protein [Chthoniobacterales bacterium]